MIWLFILLLPLVAQAANLPQPSDVVFVHDGVSEDKQDSYNYIFTVDGDDRIHTCQANRCSLLPFREQASVAATFYQLPEGYQRVAGVVDQGVLQEYVAAAAAQYRLTDLETELSATTTTRSYHTVTIHTDGSYDRDATSQERNLKPEDADSKNRSVWLWWLAGVIVVMGGGAGWILWKRRN